MLLGIDWDNDSYVIIDLKKETMTFDLDGTKVIKSLDPYQGPWYIDLTMDNMENDVLDQIYNLTIEKREDYIYPTTDGSIGWWNMISFDNDYEVSFTK